MRKKLLTTTLFCLLLSALAGGFSALALAYRQPIPGGPQHWNLDNLRSSVKADSLDVSQGTGEKDAFVASGRIREEWGSLLSDVKSGVITLMRANGEHLITAPVVLHEAGIACNPDPQHLYSANLYSFEMKSTTGLARLIGGETVYGLLTINIAGEGLTIKLPGTQATVVH